MWAQAVNNTAGEGLTDTMAFLYTESAFMAYFERSPGLKKASAIYQFRQDMNGAGGSFRVKRWREEPREGDMIEVASNYQFKAVASDCAHHIGKTLT